MQRDPAVGIKSGPSPCCVYGTHSVRLRSRRRLDSGQTINGRGCNKVTADKHTHTHNVMQPAGAFTSRFACRCLSLVYYGETLVKEMNSQRIPEYPS